MLTGKIITFHSYKGGTGKTFLSLNTAVYLAQHQGKVALLDFDFRAPTLIHKFTPDKDRRFLNDYLDDKCTIDQTLQNCSAVLQDGQDSLPKNGEFIVAYASPKTRDMQEMQMKTRQWQQKALTMLMKGLQEMKSQFDWILLDSSPGVTYDSLNAMSSSDAVILVATPDKVDINGTSEMVADLYASLIKFGAQPALVLNKVPQINNRSELYPTLDIENKFKEEAQIPVISSLPCYCDSSLIDTTILVTENPDHPLISNIEDIYKHILEL